MADRRTSRGKSDAILAKYGVEVRTDRGKARFDVRPVQNTHAFRSAFLWSGVVVCLFFAGCLDEAAEHSDRGMALWKKGKYDEAIAEFDKAIELNPKSGKAFYYRANVYYDDHRYSNAWDDVHTAEELGYRIAPRFLEVLREVSGRER